MVNAWKKAAIWQVASNGGRAMRSAAREHIQAAARAHCAGGREHPLCRRHAGPDSAGGASDAGLGSMVRPGAEAAVFAIGHRSWRLEQTTGNGHLVDWVPDRRHAQAAGRAMPKAVTAMGGLYALKGKITTPDTLTAEFEFETCPVVWWHRLWGAVERDPEFSNGVTLFGEKETLFVSDNRWMILPKGRDAQRKVMDVKHTPEVGPRHMKEWLDAIGGGPKPACSPEDAFLSTATVQLGMIAYRAARTIQWDAQTGRIVNDPAVKMMIRPYRAPYRHPGV